MLDSDTPAMMTMVMKMIILIIRTLKCRCIQLTSVSKAHQILNSKGGDNEAKMFQLIVRKYVVSSTPNCLDNWRSIGLSYNLCQKNGRRLKDDCSN